MKKLLLLLLALVLVSSVGATNYYMDTQGNSTSTNCILSNPCVNMFQLQSITLSAGDTVYFDNCDIFRGNYSFDDNDGSAGSMISFTSNGTCGYHARIWGSFNYSSTSNWSLNGSNIWQTSPRQLPHPAYLLFRNTNDYANKIGLPIYGHRETTFSGLNTNWDYYYNTTTDSVFLYLDSGNPATYANGIEIENAEIADDTRNFYINAKDYIWIHDLDFAFSDGAIRTQLCQYCNLTNLNFAYTWTKTVWFNGDGTGGSGGGRFNTIENCTFNQTGLRMSQDFIGGQGEGVFFSDMDSVKVLNNTFDYQYGVVINGLTSEDVTISGNIVYNVPYDDSIPAAYYCEGCNRTLIAYNKAFNVINGINVGVEATTKRANNYTIHHNVINSVTNMINSDAGSAVYLTNINISQNTFVMTNCSASYANSKLFLLDNFNALNITNNIFYSTCLPEGTTDFQAYVWTNTTSPNLTSDYNAFYSLAGNWNWTTDATTYDGLSQWQTGTFKDLNSEYLDPEFIDFFSGDFRPFYNSPVCSMSSTGSYVGALPCAAGLITSLNLSNVGYHSLDNDSVTINWTLPSDPDYNYTNVYLNLTLMGNTTSIPNFFNLINLTSSTGYVVTLIPYDDYGNFGNTETVSFTTLSNNITLPPSTNFTVLGNEYWINLTFLQRPYFLSFNLSSNHSDTKVINIQEDAYNYTYNTELPGNEWVDGNDGDWSSSAEIGSAYAGYQFYLYHNFYNYANYTGREIYANYSVRAKYGGSDIYCQNKDTGNYVYLGSDSYSYSSYTRVDSSYQINSTCLTGSNITLRFGLVNSYGSGVLQFYDSLIYSINPYYIKFEDETIYNSTNATGTNTFFNLTGYANNNIDENITLKFGAMWENTFTTNYSYALVYSKEINVSVYENGGTTILNPTCSFNSETVYPKTELIYYNSSLINYLECSVNSSYTPLAQYIYPTADAFNLSMSTTTLNLNVTFKDEVNKSIINWTTIYLELLSDDYSYNYSTSNGTLILSNIFYSSYVFRFVGDSYSERFWNLDIAEGTNQILNLYLLRNGATVSFYVFDQFSSPVEEAVIYIYRYDLSTNSYILIAQKNTDWQGKADIDLEFNTEFYKVSIGYNDEIKLTTGGFYINQTRYDFQINTYGSIFESYFDLNDVTYQPISFNEATGNFGFYYTDEGTNSIESACLNVYIANTTGKYAYDSTCLTDQGATILINAVNVSGRTYFAEAILTIDGISHTVSTRYYTYRQTEVSSGLAGVFLWVIATIFFFFLGIKSGEARVIMILTPLPTLIFAYIGFITFISMDMAVGLFVAFMILAFVLEDKR